MRCFELHRVEDISGVSGTGVVAQGVEFDDGCVALRWLTEWPTSVVFHDRGAEAVEHVHGHNGRTRVVWLDSALAAPNDNLGTPAGIDTPGPTARPWTVEGIAETLRTSFGHPPITDTPGAQIGERWLRAGRAVFALERLNRAGATPNPQDMVRALHLAVFGDTWARPESPAQVWAMLLDRVERLAQGQCGECIRRAGATPDLTAQQQAVIDAAIEWAADEGDGIEVDGQHQSTEDLCERLAFAVAALVREDTP